MQSIMEAVHHLKKPYKRGGQKKTLKAVMVLLLMNHQLPSLSLSDLLVNYCVSIKGQYLNDREFFRLGDVREGLSQLHTLHHQWE